LISAALVNVANRSAVIATRRSMSPNEPKLSRRWRERILLGI
jgi:hypothetical protein